MDFFGIGNALKAGFGIYFNGARRTGRTTHLLNNLNDGDQVICLTARAARHLEHLAKEKGLSIKVTYCHPKRINDIYIGRKLKCNGRTIFDHEFVEEWHNLNLTNSINTLDHIQSELSGRDTPEFERHYTYNP